MEPTGGMQSLEPEFVRLIFARLDMKDRGSLAQVCREWNSIIDAPCVWADKEVRVRLDEGTTAEQLACFGRRAVRKLKVTTVGNPLLHLPRLMKAVPETKSLDLSYCHNLTDDAILVTFTGPQWASLTVLDLSFCNLITDVSIAHITRQCRNLEELRLNRCRRITDFCAGYIAENLSKLKTLEMVKTKVSDRGLRLLGGLNEQGLPSGAGSVGSLECLSIKTCYNVKDDGLYYISVSMPRLVVLELWQVRDVTLTGIEHIAKIPTLRKLTLFECRNMTGLWLDILSTRPFPLYYLDISQCFHMDSTAVLSIATGPSLLGLTTLRMVGLRVKDYVLSFVAKKLTKLEHLDISKCRMITKEGIAALATHLPGLRVLHMRFTTHLRDGIFRHLCRMPCLETVNLKGCRRISGGGPRAIACGDFRPAFFELDVSFTGIGDTGVRYIIAAMPQLRYLNLSGCIISDRTVSLIARRMRHLHTLRLVRCREITDRSLEMIGTHMKDLRLIDLRANPRVSKTAKRNLTVALPQLKFLYLEPEDKN